MQRELLAPAPQHQGVPAGSRIRPRAGTAARSFTLLVRLSPTIGLTPKLLRVFLPGSPRPMAWCQGEEEEEPKWGGREKDIFH